MIKTIKKTLYQTSDGEEFECMEDAVHHERVDRLSAMLDNSGLFFNQEYSSIHDIAKWLITNRESLNTIMNEAD